MHERTAASTIYIFTYLLNVGLKHAEHLLAGVHREVKSHFPESWISVLRHIPHFLTQISHLHTRVSSGDLEVFSVRPSPSGEPVPQDSRDAAW